jgi:hypothetical protein
LKKEAKTFANRAAFPGGLSPDMQKFFASVFQKSRPSFPLAAIMLTWRGFAPIS